MSAHPEGYVAVVAQWRDGRTGMPSSYVNAVELAGGRPHVFSTFEPPQSELPSEVPVKTGLDPYDTSPLDGAMGLVIPGGGDIDPTWYGQDPHPRTRNVSHRRDRFELTLLEEALERDLPVLAICHGMQLLNVHLGGSLHQHLSDDPHRLDHDRDAPRADPSHSAKIRPDTLLDEVFRAQHIEVNSSHHQGLDRVASELEEVAWAQDGVLEAVVARDHTWVVGVQWHPEAMAAVDPVQRLLFEAFVEASSDYASSQGALSAAHG